MISVDKEPNAVTITIHRGSETHTETLTVEQALAHAIEVMQVAREAMTEHREALLAEAERVVGRRAD